ncbi:MAG: hypothetical protein JWP65_718 [Ramlibacter sp.]|jgi:hypothetical protein|uniref:PXPV repeat protein n=1 Tax=Ramlibacter sp. TaxID=1917967 RepID=UPI00260D22EB|nr:PXPV repeat protein [Ramlibacter sp.]MDB5750297.1 hypothetical protein [Ramlibacter sp.]
MQRLSSTKFLFAALVACCALGAASAAHARTDVHLSIGVPFGGYVQPAPIYYQPRPVYVQPAPVYVQPAPVYYYPTSYHGRGGRSHDRRGAWGDADRDGVPNIHDRYFDDRHFDGRHFDGRRGGWRDADRDGVPNRHDRAPHNPYHR